MTDVKKLQTLDGMLDYPDPNDASKGTTEQQFQEYLKNQYAVMYSLVSMALWQPGTNYIKEQVVLSPNMPANAIARVTTEGTSGDAEPVWGAVGSTISDGTAAYIMLPRTIDFATQAEVTAGTDKDKIVTPASLSTLLTQIYAQAKLDAHPVGSIYESTGSTSPATLFGGTWEAMDAGRVLVAQGKAATGTTFAAGATGGEEKHKLTTSEMPAHAHDRGTMNITGTVCSAYGETKTTTSGAFTWGNTGGRQDGGDGHDGEVICTSTISFDASKNWTGETSTVGDGVSHNNLQPYTVVYRWRRTA